MTSTVHTTTKMFGSLKMADWPEADRSLMQQARKPKTFLRPGGAASDWREKTLETVIYRNGVFLWWLGDTGRLIPGSTPLERVTLQNIEAFINDYGAGHASTSLAGTLHGVYEATRVMHPEADLSDLLEAVASVKAIAKPRPKLPRMADHGALVELGEALIAHGAKRASEGHMLSAAAVRDGCVVLFEIACPLRRTSLEGLRLSHSLLRDELGYRVALGPKQMKTGQAFEAPLAAWLTPRLDFYVDVGRPVLQARSGRPDEGWLWLGAEGEHMTGKAISRRVRQLITRHLGRAMSLHLFRDSAATTVAIHDSAHVGIVGDVLGHSRHETSEKHYNQARGVEAARRYHGLLKEQGRGAS
jgi:integrase/recombinase XerD